MADFAVGMTQESDGSFKLKMVHEVDANQAVLSGRSNGQVATKGRCSASLLGVVALGGLLLLVAQMRELLTDAGALQADIAELRTTERSNVLVSELQSLRHIVEAGVVEPRQLLKLLAPGPSNNIAAEPSAALKTEVDDLAESAGWATSAASILLLVALVVPAVVVVMNEHKIGTAKQDVDGFVWTEQIAYRMDFWLSNYPSAKTWALMIVTCMLIAVGALMYGPVHEDDGADALHHALWSSWIFVVTQSASDQETFFGRLVALFIAIGGMLIFALLVGIISDAIRCGCHSNATALSMFM
eukprot:SAG31_NODE_3030_length_4767_cov_3.085904_4_plen_300_part_00